MSSRNTLEVREVKASKDLTLDDIIEGIIKKTIPYPPRLTKYEIARIVSARALQLASNAKPLIDVKKLNTYDPVKIALEELKEGKLPIIIVRTLPNNKKLEIRLRELQDLESKLGTKISY